MPRRLAWPPRSRPCNPPAPSRRGGRPATGPAGGPPKGGPPAPRPGGGPPAPRPGGGPASAGGGAGGGPNCASAALGAATVAPSITLAERFSKVFFNIPFLLFELNAGFCEQRREDVRLVHRSRCPEGVGFFRRV